ncbi:MAG TPA: SDR family oxidoreductase [Acidimicrobiales bacterium]|nr:SDR family oxidoreductase [Acidimicrobiales bacterium]
MAERRVAIVTGADSGIGKATAVELARAGHDLGLTWHADEEGIEGTAEECRALGAKVELRQVDLADVPAAGDVVDDLADALGRLDALVNNAGTGVDTPFLEQDFDDVRHVLAVDLEAPFVLGQRAARRMVEQGTGGVIVNVTSVHEHVPLPGATAYCMAKGGLGLLTKSMALELAEHGIRVVSLAPGEISTPMTGQHDVDPAEEDRPGIPWGRPGSAYEMAATVAFLVSEGATYITGASIVADGGLTLMAAVR